MQTSETLSATQLFQETAPYTVDPEAYSTDTAIPPTRRGESNSRTTEKATPIAFVLDYEQQKARQEGDTYLPEFFNSLMYYAKETYGKVPIASYHYDLEERKDGPTLLKPPGRNEYVRHSFSEPLNNPNLPPWYLARVHKDLQYLSKLENDLLPNAKPGDVFVNFSPASYDVPLEERQKVQMGAQSFVFLYQVGMHEGRKVLQATAVRNYLNVRQQTDLYNSLTGETQTEATLLGSINKLNRRISVTDEGDMRRFHKELTDLYFKAPPNERIQIPEKDKIAVDEEDFVAKVEHLQPYVIALFHLLRECDDKLFIQYKFVEWEKKIKQALQGSRKYEALGATALLEDYYRITADKYTYAAEAQFMMQQVREAQSEGNSCGNGIGFLDNKVFKPVGAFLATVPGNFVPNYAGAAASFEELLSGEATTTERKPDGIHEECVGCPVCGNEGKNPKNYAQYKSGKIVRYICGNSVCASNRKN